MTAVMLLAFAVGASDAWREAAEAHAAGLASAHDASRARSHFRRAAVSLESLWRDSGLDSPALHRNRARAYFLAGDLPNALRACREGRRSWPADAPLRDLQEALRSRVVYPAGGDLRDRAMPRSPWRWTERVAPRSALGLGFAAYAAGWACVGLGLARRRRGWWVAATLAWAAGAASVGQAWREHRERAADANWAVVATEIRPRLGNGAAFPPALAARLPVGVEVRVRHRRGGWARIELADGTPGWVPRSAVVEAADASPQFP